MRPHIIRGEKTQTNTQAASLRPQLRRVEGGGTCAARRTKTIHAYANLCPVGRRQEARWKLACQTCAAPCASVGAGATACQMRPSTNGATASPCRVHRSSHLLGCGFGGGLGRRCELYHLACRGGWRLLVLLWVLHEQPAAVLWGVGNRAAVDHVALLVARLTAAQIDPMIASALHVEGVL